MKVLVGALRDKEGDVRESADEALRRNSGQDFDFYPDAAPSEREPAIAKWEAWLKNPVFAPPPEASTVPESGIPPVAKDPATTPPPPPLTPEQLKAAKAKEKEEKKREVDEKKKERNEKKKEKSDSKAGTAP